MADAIYGFDSDTVEKIAQTVRGYEADELTHEPVIEAHYDSATASVEVVRVTSTTQVNGEFPGKLQQIDPSTTPPTFSDTTTDVWVLGPNAEMLELALYVARMDGDGNTPVRPRFIAVSTAVATGGAVVVRVPSDGTANHIAACFVENWTDGDPPGHSDGPSSWAYDINGGIVRAGFYLAAFLATHVADSKKIYGIESGLSTNAKICVNDGMYHCFTWVIGKLTDVDGAPTCT